MGSATSHQPMLYVTPSISKMGCRYPNLSFFHTNFYQKPWKAIV